MPNIIHTAQVQYNQSHTSLLLYNHNDSTLICTSLHPTDDVAEMSPTNPAYIDAQMKAMEMARHTGQIPLSPTGMPPGAGFRFGITDAQAAKARLHRCVLEADTCIRPVSSNIIICLAWSHLIQYTCFTFTIYLVQTYTQTSKSLFYSFHCVMLYVVTSFIECLAYRLHVNLGRTSILNGGVNYTKKPIYYYICYYYWPNLKKGVTWACYFNPNLAWAYRTNLTCR